jgi:unsaturated rhamnogalacturonyl hydrolase
MCRNLAFTRAITAILLSILSAPALSQVDIAGSWAIGTSHTKEAGTDRALIFIAHAEHQGVISLDSVTYGGQLMTKVNDVIIGTDWRAYAAAFVLDEAGVADANNDTFVPNWSTTPSYVVYSSVFLENANQTAITAASATNGSASSTPNPITTSALATNDGDMVILGATAGNSGSYTLQNGFTEGNDQSFGGTATGVTGYKSASGAAETPSAQHSSPNRQVIIGFVVNGMPPDPNIASNPDPNKGAEDVSVSTNLSWNEPTAYTPTSYDVYLGTDTTAHNNPKYTVYTNSYDPPTDLLFGTTYYWAVDSNDNGTIYPSKDWYFTTIENKAANPNPNNGEINVSVTTNLSWTVGISMTSQDLYFGTDPNVYNNSMYVLDTNTFDPPGDLSLGSEYYWVVDTNDDGIIYPGDLWTFSTPYPVTVGGLVADYILSQTLTDYYATICSYYGVLLFSAETGNTGLKNSVIAAYEPYYTGQQTPPEGHVDDNVFGILPFELYYQTGDPNYLTVAQYLADKEFENPDENGLSPYSRFAVDDLYMIGSLQAQAYKSTSDPNYIDHAVTQLLGYMGVVEQLQDPNGLFYHALDAPIFWGRGNGWAAAAMTEVLSKLPEDDPNRPQLLTNYQNMMSALVEYQDANGMWYQVLNMPSHPDNWVESSCTGMFTFALATGVKNGWLPEVPYKQAAIDAWAELQTYVDEQGRVHEVCTGTWKGSTAQYYFDRPREIGNHHGQAAVIWAATAMLQLQPDADLNDDWEVDFYDLEIMSENWLGSSTADIAPPEGDGIVNFLDFAEFANCWLK